MDFRFSVFGLWVCGFRFQGFRLLVSSFQFSVSWVLGFGFLGYGLCAMGFRVFRVKGCPPHADVDRDEPSEGVHGVTAAALKLAQPEEPGGSGRGRHEHAAVPLEVGEKLGTQNGGRGRGRTGTGVGVGRRREKSVNTTVRGREGEGISFSYPTVDNQVSERERAHRGRECARAPPALSSQRSPPKIK